MSISRRTFLAQAAAVVACASEAKAAKPALPLGLQLYSVREQMAADFEGTLARIRSLGFTEVESAALPHQSAKEIRAALDAAGLRCVSAHHPYGELHARFDEIVAHEKEIGSEFIICSSPGRRPGGNQQAGGRAAASLDDWKFNAEEFNTLGEKLKTVGMQFGYHNHTAEFAVTEGVVPYLELLKLCERDKVTFELDCGWARVAGQDPAALMAGHPGRFSMLHLKDFVLPSNPSPEKREEAKVVELGTGNIDYKPIMAAPKQVIRHAFVEQEKFTVPWEQALKLDAEYVKRLLRSA